MASAALTRCRIHFRVSGFSCGDEATLSMRCCSHSFCGV